MTASALYTVQEVARLFHVSDDTVRRQIRGGDLAAIQIGTTPGGRPRYRIPAEVVERRLSQGAAVSSAASALDRFRALFAELEEHEREELLEKAIAWARAQRDAAPAPTLPALTPEEIARRLSPEARKLLDASRLDTSRLDTSRRA